MGRSVANVKTIRRIGSVSSNHQQLEPGFSSANECDTNADTCCLGRNFVVLEYTNMTEDVYAYDKDIAPLNNIPIVSVATSYHDVATLLQRC